MTDLWRLLTFGRAISRKVHRAEVAAAYNEGHEDGRIARRVAEYTTPAEPGSVTLGPGMAVWDDDPEPAVS